MFNYLSINSDLTTMVYVHINTGTDLKRRIVGAKKNY